MSQQNGCCPVKMAGLYRFPSARHKHTHTQVVLQMMACSVCTTLHPPTQLQTIALSQYINVGWVWSIHKQSSTTTPHQGHLDAMIESRRSLPIASSFASLVLTGPHWSSLVLTGPHWSSLAHLHTYQTQVFSCSQESTLHRRVGWGW